MSDRLAIPLAGLGLYAVLAGLWHGGYPVYFDAIRLLGVEPFGFPFLDIDFVLSAADCRRQGFDVYLSNPCDALGRVFDYSPLWLTIMPRFLSRAASGWAGLSLGLLFIFSWVAVLRPRTAKDALMLGLGAASPMTLYALERANVDIFIFLLIVSGGMLLSASRHWRLCAYAVWSLAALLKFYPLALLILVARERRREAAAVAISTSLIMILLGIYFHVELGKTFANLPKPSYFTDSFSFENLPFGFAEALSEGFGRFLIALPLLSVLVTVAMARAIRTLRLLDREIPDWSGRELQWLPLGSIMVTACFFAGQNINYRGIYFLLVLPGLVSLYRSTGERAIRRFYGQMVAAVLFVMWEEFFRRILHSIATPGTGQGLGSRAEVVLWVGRELVWWWLVVGLAAIVWAYLRRLPLLEECIIRIRRLRTASRRQTG